MKQIDIKIKIGNDKMATNFTYEGIVGNPESTEQILETVGVLENLKHQMLEKLKIIKRYG